LLGGFEAMQVSIASWARRKARSPAPAGWLVKKDWTSDFMAGSQNVAVAPRDRTDGSGTLLVQHLQCDFAAAHATVSRSD